VDQDPRPVGKSSSSGVVAVGTGAANRAVEYAANATGGDAAGELARAGDLAP
jgi:hypothetical protein